MRWEKKEGEGRRIGEMGRKSEVGKKGKKRKEDRSDWRGSL